MSVIREAILDLLAEEHPMTARQLFYRLVSAGVVPKTENEYTRTVLRLLKEMRLNYAIPFAWIADNTRWMRKPTTYDSAEQALRATARAYRQSVWQRQEDYVEVWIEKDALAGVLYDVTASWDVPLMVTRGYASLSFLYIASEAIAAVGKPSFVYILSDYDPSGVDLARNVEERLHEFAPDADLYVERVAVTPEQIEEWQLPTRPTKKTDTRGHEHGDRSVELDAIPATVLRELVETTIAQHIDQHELEYLGTVEASEREILLRMAQTIDGEVG